MVVHTRILGNECRVVVMGLVLGSGEGVGGEVGEVVSSSVDVRRWSRCDALGNRALGRLLPTLKYAIQSNRLLTCTRSVASGSPPRFCFCFFFYTRTWNERGIKIKYLRNVDFCPRQLVQRQLRRRKGEKERPDISRLVYVFFVFANITATPFNRLRLPLRALDFLGEAEF